MWKFLLLLRSWVLIYCQERNDIVRVLRHCNTFSRISISNWFNFLIVYIFIFNVRNVELNSHPVIDFWIFPFLFSSNPRYNFFFFIVLSIFFCFPFFFLLLIFTCMEFVSENVKGIRFEFVDLVKKSKCNNGSKESFYLSFPFTKCCVSFELRISNYLSQNIQLWLLKDFTLLLPKIVFWIGNFIWEFFLWWLFVRT